MNYWDQINILNKLEIGDPVQLKGKILKEIYVGKNDYRIYSCEDENGNEIKITITTPNPLICEQFYNIEGQVTNYKNEKQIKVHKFEGIKPSTKSGFIKLLTSLKGIGGKTSASIYEMYGENSIEVLIKNPYEVIQKVKGINSKNISSWKENLEAYGNNYQTFAELLNLPLSKKQSNKIYELYGSESINKIKENPYHLYGSIKGITFEKCDQIASFLGVFDSKSKFRIQTCILNGLQKAKKDGNCFLPTHILLKDCNEILSTKQFNSESEIKKQLTYLSDEKKVVIENEKIYLYSLYEDELKVAEYVKMLKNEQTFKKQLELESVLDDFLKKKKIHLEEKQREAVLEFSKNRGGFFILTGSAGCGKTFTLLNILEMLGKQYKHNGIKFSVRLLAPTGKASKVASKSTGMDCVTVHRGLGYNGTDAFDFNENNPLDVEVVIVDESSMLDVSLTRQLLSALRPKTKVIFLGDTKQLPSIGPGNVLKDMINSKQIKVVTLNVVKRQKGISGIITNANNIANKKEIENYNDAQILYKGSSEQILNHALDKIEMYIKNGSCSMNDIQILTPRKGGYLGTYHLNYQIQQKFNPGKNRNFVFNSKGYSELKKINESFELNFKVGDKVMHTKNNYDVNWYEKDGNEIYSIIDTKKEITNGESGVIEGITKLENENGDEVTRLIVHYEDGYVFYDNYFDEIEHAYAMSIHKSQGSQWKVVIILIADEHGQMRNNNLFYTGYTRAEDFNIVIGQSSSINFSIQNERSTKRYTNLSDKIIKACIDNQF